MAIRVLVVDDSGFFRRRVSEMLNADPALEVVGQAANGEEAIAQAAKLRPDVITMDIEMPVLDGISATRRIMARTPTPIIMFSSLTTEGAKATLDALDAGALDFLPKRFEDIASDREEARRLLCQRVRDLGRKGRAGIRKPVTTRPPVTARPAARPQRAASGPIRLLAIGTSTGGPVALQKVLTRLPANFPAPILLIQHMPGTFTPAFAKRLDQQCAIRVREAADGDRLEPGLALLAPGGRQMLLDGRPGSAVVRIGDDPGQTYKPSVDLTFTSIAKVHPRDTLAVVLTGMGADGAQGARLLHERGSSVWAQDEASCVVYGMPAAVVEAGIAEQVLSLDEMGDAIARRVR